MLFRRLIYTLVVQSVLIHAFQNKNLYLYADSRRAHKLIVSITVKGLPQILNTTANTCYDIAGQNPKLHPDFFFLSFSGR